MHARFFVFFFFFLFLLLFAGHRQISGRLLGGPRHHGPKFGVLPASAPHVQVLFFPNFFYLHFVYFQPQPRMFKYSAVFPASTAYVREFVFTDFVSTYCIGRACQRICFQFFIFLFSASGADVQVLCFAEYFYIVILMPYHVSV
jgi:hypothetical protein